MRTCRGNSSPPWSQNIMKSTRLVRCGMDGIDNGALYELAAREYDLCFTRDAEFARRVSESKTVTRVKLIRILIPQTRQDEFVDEFLAAFRQTDWADYANGDDWP